MIRRMYLAVLLTAILFLPTVEAQNKNRKTEADIRVFAVDASGNLLQNLTAGKYAALLVEASLSTFPDKASTRISAQATFETRVLGQPVKYSINLPVSAGAGSGIDPTIGLRTSGQKLGRQFENKFWRERLDFYIPREAPAGRVSVTIRATASSAKPISRKFDFKVVRP